MVRYKDTAPHVPVPYTAPNLSRRQFLQGTAGLAVIALVPIGIGTAPPPKTIRLVGSEASIVLKKMV